MAGVQKGDDGKTPENLEDPKYEEKGARSKEFKNRDKKSSQGKGGKKKLTSPSGCIKEQSESPVTESESYSILPRPLSCTKKLVTSSEDLRWQDPGKDGKTPENLEDPKYEEKGARPKEFKNLEKKRRRGKRGKKKLPSPSGCIKGQSESPVTEIKSYSVLPRPLSCTRKLFASSEDLTQHPESKPVDEKVGQKSKKGVHFADSQGMNLTEVRSYDKEKLPQVPVSAFSMLVIDPEQTRTRTKGGHKLWISPDKIRPNTEEYVVSQKSETCVILKRRDPDNRHMRTENKVNIACSSVETSPEEKKTQSLDNQPTFKRKPEDTSDKKKVD